MNDDTVSHSGKDGEDGEHDTEDGEGEGERRQPCRNIYYVAGTQGQATDTE